METRLNRLGLGLKFAQLELGPERRKHSTFQGVVQTIFKSLTSNWTKYFGLRTNWTKFGIIGIRSSKFEEHSSFGIIAWIVGVVFHTADSTSIFCNYRFENIVPVRELCQEERLQTTIRRRTFSTPNFCQRLVWRRVKPARGESPSPGS